MGEQAAPHQMKDSRTRILLAARSLFDHRGFHQTPMAHVADAAQVSVGQIYRLFRSKEDVISAIIEDDATRLQEQLQKLRDELDDGQIAIDQVFERILLDAASDEQEALSFDILAESLRKEQVGDIVASMCGRIRGMLRHFARAANPALTSDALDVAEELLLACLFGIGHRRASRPKMDAVQIAKDGGAMITRALQAIS